MKCVNKAAFQKMVADDYVNRYVRGIYEPLDKLAPETMREVKAMATGAKTLDEAELAAAIEKIGGKENPILDMEYETSPGRTMDLRERAVGVYMSANKLSRDQLYRYMFVKVYKKATKDGLSPEKAAGVARDAAELKVPQVHFDLANALVVEQKYRWFSWFATKQRLYTQWLARWATRNPFQVAAVSEFIGWLEDRNDRKGVPEWQRHDLTGTIAGRKVTIPLGLLTWTAHDYPMESTTGQLIKYGASLPLAAAGITKPFDLQQAMAPFGPSTGPWDGLALTAGLIVRDFPEFIGGEMTDDELQAKINGMSAAEQKRWDEAINLQRIAALHNGEDITMWEATKRAIYGALKHEAWNSFRPVPIHYETQDQKVKSEMIEKMNKFFSMDPDKRPDWLAKPENEDLRIFFGLHDNPVEQANYDDAAQAYQIIRSDFVEQLRTKVKTGEIYTPSAWADMKEERDAAIGKLQQDNPWFAKWLSLDPETSDKDMRDKLGVAFPLMDTAQWWEQNRLPTTEEIAVFKRDRTEELNNFIKTYGVSEGDRGENPAATSNPLYQIARYFMVDKPLQDYAKIDPETGQKYKEDAIVYYLARGGRTGLYLADAYRQTVQSQHKVDIMLKGNNKGRANPNKPQMVYLSPEDKNDVFWNSNPSTMNTWFDWAKGQATIKNDLLNRGIKTTTKAGKAEYEQRMNELNSKLAQQNPDWAAEYNWSMLPLHEKLREMGVGSGKTITDKGWSTFLDDVEQARESLASLDVVTFDGKKAKPVAEWLTNQILTLKKENPAWWKNFSLHMDVRDFGLGAWHFPGDAELYPEFYDRIDYGEEY